MKKLFLAILLSTLCSLAFGQEPGLTFAKVDSLPDLIQYYLRETTSKHFEDPKVPRFLLKDRTDNFVFGVGGGVQAKMFYDRQGSKGNVFSLSKDDEESKYDNDVVDFTLYATNLVFKVLGKTETGVIDALISVDFGNTGGGIRLMQAYVDVFGLRIGKANSAFSDDESMSMVDCFGLLTTTGRKVPQVAYSYRFKNGLRIQAGVEFTQSTSVWMKNRYNVNQIKSMDILLPDLTANAYYSGERVHLYGGVNSRLMNYYDSHEYFKGIPTYAVQAGMNWSFFKRADQTHKLYAQAIFTHGMADCCTGMRNQGLSAVYYHDSEKSVIPNLFGASLGYQVVFGNNTFDLAASFASASGQQSANIGEMFGYAYSGVLNYFRKFLHYGTFGAEVIAGRRFDVNSDTRSNIRAYLFLRYDF